MSVHHRRYSDGGASPNYVINNIRLDVVEEIKDLGVCGTQKEKLTLIN